MAIENAEAPGRDREETCAGEENAHQTDGQLELGPRESRRNNAGQKRRGEYADEDQARHCQGEQAEHRAGDVVRLIFCFTGKQIGIYGDEGSRERPLAKEVLQEIRDAERSPEGVGRVGVSEIVGKNTIPQQTGDAAEQDTRCHQCCMVIWPGTSRLFHIGILCCPAVLADELDKPAPAIVFLVVPVLFVFHVEHQVLELFIADGDDQSSNTGISSRLYSKKSKGIELSLRRYFVGKKSY